ncbi:MAG: ACP S-malonyltransferase [Tatlockia sp.]|nr:ACP S-malonyltransferase [Tatlockia sp.]
MTTLMFPGQGSQYKGMGLEIFTESPDELRVADEILGYSLEELCIHDPNQQLNNTEYTQPALFAIESLEFTLKYSGKKPDYCIGHSLGEFSALYAAGAFDFATGLKLVKKRGELMANATGGGMLAVIDLSFESIISELAENNIDTIDFANFNSSKQIILSGPAEDIKKANLILSKKTRKCIPLAVSGAFHSRYMAKAAASFEDYLKNLTFTKLHTTVLANATAEPYTEQTLKTLLVKQITSPVRWDVIIKTIKNKAGNEFIEVGPGKVLTRLLLQS